MNVQESRIRILVIDDSESIHNDFQRILCPARTEKANELDLMEQALFGTKPSRDVFGNGVFEVDSAFQGRDGVAKVQQSLVMGRPYSLVFLDYRMPPGWNGIETLRHLWKVAPSLRVVLCSAYSEYSWPEVLQEFHDTPLLTELRKPFDSQELRRLAQALTSSGQ